jgi:acyl-CoA synthetase (AMP-forming)/AMP-acid ligase II
VNPAGITVRRADPTDTANIWQLIRERSESDPDRVLVMDENGQQLSFAELRSRAESVAAGLLDLGIGPGDVVSWQLPSRIDTVVLLAACARLDVIQNPLIAMLREHEVEFIVTQTGSRLLVVPAVFRGFDHVAMAHSIASRRPDLLVWDADSGLPMGDPTALPAPSEPTAAAWAVRWLFYTSGTTAAPKGARHTDAGLLAASRTFCTNMNLQPEDRTTSLSPMAHVGGVLHVISAVVTGSRIVITEIFDPASTPEQMSAARVTLGGSGVPFLQAYLTRQRERPDDPFFPYARAFLVGGAPRPPSLHYDTQRELGGVGIVSGYGMTECPYLSWGRIDDPDEKLACSEGRPVPATEIKILDVHGAKVPPGVSGELRVRAPQLMLGYVDAALDAEAFDEDGFFRTGDLAMVDADGYLSITGRIKDVIIRNMENISAREVENMALTFPQAREIAAIGLPDEQTGERVVAVVVPADPQSPPTLQELCAHLRASGLNPRKLPVQLELADELPRNAMGKVMKKDLRTRYLS